MVKIDFHIQAHALTGIAEECGDMGFGKSNGDTCFLALVDALGHGPVAHDIAVTAISCLEKNHDKPPAETITCLHRELKGTRGAVAAVCRVDARSGSLTYAGMGNICLRILGSRRERLITREGILGYMIPTPRQAKIRLLPGDILLMTSDGIREHFDPDAYPELFTGSARDIARGLIRDLGKQNDDTSCIVLRYGI